MIKAQPRKMDNHGKPSNRTPIVVAGCQESARRVILLGMLGRFIEQELQIGQRVLQGSLIALHVGLI